VAQLQNAPDCKVHQSKAAVNISETILYGYPSHQQSLLSDSALRDKNNKTEATRVDDIIRLETSMVNRPDSLSLQISNR
jgi:hypothetical protein